MTVSYCNSITSGTDIINRISCIAIAPYKCIWCRSAAGRDGLAIGVPHNSLRKGRRWQETDGRTSGSIDDDRIGLQTRAAVPVRGRDRKGRGPRRGGRSTQDSAGRKDQASRNGSGARAGGRALHCGHAPGPAARAPGAVAGGA